jgi:hypothetical protein
MLPGLLLLLLPILQLLSAVVGTCNYCCILVEIHQVSQVAHTVLLLLLLLLLLLPPPLLHRLHVLLALALGIPEPFAPFYNSSCHHAFLYLSLSLGPVH